MISRAKLELRLDTDTSSAIPSAKTNKDEILPNFHMKDERYLSVCVCLSMESR